MGSNYREYYNVGDIVEFGDLGNVHSYKVIGFYKPGVGMHYDYASSQNIVFDNSIVVPIISPHINQRMNMKNLKKIFKLGNC